MPAPAAGFLSVSQFAAREGVSRPRVLQLLAAHRIDGAIRIGRQWAIPLAAGIDRRKPGRPRRSKGESEARLLNALARKYVWWMAPARAAANARLVAAQVMELGDYGDVIRLEAGFGRARLRDALQHARAGQFSPRSWNYWHHRLGLAKAGAVPPLPRRRLR